MAPAEVVVPVRPMWRRASSLLEPLAMDSIAIIADLHGNLPALEAVLGDINLKPSDRVIWWKRIPGGDYVYPVQATVLALTEKRGKIEADDDGKIVRYVPPENLQRQG
jgi:hypothetical protein